MNDTIPAPPPRAARIHPCSRAEYDAIDATRYSALSHMATSPLAYRHALDVPREATAAMVLGSAAHALTLGTEADDLAIFYGEARRGKAWDAFEAANAGRTIVKESELTTARAIADAVHRDRRARNMLALCRSEVAVTWTHDDGRPCKSRLDALGYAGGGVPWAGPARIVELKTTRRIEAFPREAAARMYHAQLAYYAHGVALATGQAPDVHMVAVSNVAPHDVIVYRVTPATLAKGWALCTAWLARLAECERLQSWPGVANGEEQELDVPDHGDASLTLDGEDVTP